MTARNALTALSLSLVFGALSTGAATAAPPMAPPFTEYAAKFTCGALKADGDDVIGTYATSINIHNPQATTGLKFVKKIVVALEEGVSPVGKIVFVHDSLGPDVAERVDCAVIEKLLNISGGTHVEGFVVIEVQATSNAASPPASLPIDVVGVYSARSVNGAVSGLDVVTYTGTLISK